MNAMVTNRHTLCNITVQLPIFKKTILNKPTHWSEDVGINQSKMEYIKYKTMKILLFFLEDLLLKQPLQLD